jgi:hypothetical protein
MGHRSWITQADALAAIRKMAQDSDGRPFAKLLRRVPIGDLAAALEETFTRHHYFSGDNPWVDLLTIITQTHNSKRKEQSWRRKWNREWQQDQAEKGQAKKEAAQDPNETAWIRIDLSIRERMRKVAAMRRSTNPNEVKVAATKLTDMIVKYAGDLEFDWVMKKLAA